MEKKTRSFRVRYLDSQNMEQTVVFAVRDGKFVDMFNSLVSLFGSYCVMTYKDDPCWLISATEVEYD